jgi:hypothetical protein
VLDIKQRIVIGVPFLVVTGLAAQVIFSSKITGDLVSANWFDPVSTSSVGINPASTPSGTAYSLFWRGCTLNPDFDHRFCTFASGLAPTSTVKTQQVDTLGLDVDTSLLSVVFFIGGEDCTSGICIQFTPPSVPLHATFTIFSGLGSFTEQTSGNDHTENIFPFGGITSSETFSGSRIRHSANFTGVVGPITVPPPPPVGSNAFLMIMHGQQTSQLVYPAAP